MPSAVSPTRASRSGMLSGSTPFSSSRVAASILARAEAVDLDHAPAAQGLAEVLVGREDAHLIEAVAEARGGGREGVVRLPAIHRPDGDADRADGLLDRTELGQELRRDALVGLVAGEEIVPERPDGVVEGDADVRHRLVPVVQQRDHRGRDADGRLGLPALGGRVAGPPREVRPEELERAVDDVEPQRRYLLSARNALGKIAQWPFTWTSPSTTMPSLSPGLTKRPQYTTTFALSLSAMSL